MRFLLLALTIPAFAQVATITGLVTDPGGAVVPAATVAATNAQTGVASSATTTSEGYYTLAQLSPGSYSIKVEKEGFGAFTRVVTVTVGQVVRLDVLRLIKHCWCIAE